MPRQYDTTNDQFSLRVEKRVVRSGVEYIHVHTVDRFSRARHRVQRRAVLLFANTLEKYLRKRPDMTHRQRGNIARRLIYISPSFRAWSAYMPGGFATYSVHNPDHKHLVAGKKVDYITKNFFRHSYDAIGLRSRAYAMSWFLQQHVRPGTTLRWASIACGTGQPTYDAAQLFDVPTHFYLADLNQDALDFARKLAHSYGIASDMLTAAQLDLTDKKALDVFLKQARPDIIEAMGLFEYLPDKDALALLKALRPYVRTTSILVFTNMRPDHPHLHVHKRGMGWPGVIQRTPAQVLALLRDAGYDDYATTVMLPDDNVYGVYALSSRQK